VIYCDLIKTNGGLHRDITYKNWNIEGLGFLKKVVWWCLMWFSGDFMGISVFFLMDDHNPDAQCYDGLASTNSWHHQWVCPVLLVPVRTRFNFTHCTVIWTSTINQS
jgi:hypothetical protein